MDIIKHIEQLKKYKNEIVITINQEKVNEFEELYFQKYPNRRKKPIESPIPPNLNRFIIWQRPQQNSTKQIWKDFIHFVAEEYSDLNIRECILHYHFIFPDKRLRDLDNYISISSKLITDGLTIKDGNGMLVDDNYNHIRFLSTTAETKKGVTELQIYIRY